MATATDYTNTYVGARYVPKFSDSEWNSSNVYEPLTMVVVNGSIYISKQYVPSGIQITNTQYWAKMPAFDTNSQTAITNAVNAWLDSHPEATTTVEDGSITYNKFSSILKEMLPFKFVNTLEEIYFEKGALGNEGVNSTYRQDNRCRSIDKLYANNDIYIGKLSEYCCVYIYYYDMNGNYINSTSSWLSYCIIPKGTVFRICFTTTNAGTPELTSVTDIFNSFLIISPAIEINKDFNWKIGLISDNGIYYYPNYPTRLSTYNYIPVEHKISMFTCNSGYKFYLKQYDKDMNLIDNSGWLTNTVFYDFKNTYFIRLLISKTNDSQQISLEESTNLIFNEYIPNNISFQNVLSICKDGINDPNYSYAPKYPKSSIISLEKAYIQGYRDFLIHVQFTSDNIPVCYHDTSINRYARNSDGTQISSTIYIRSSTLNELNNYDFGILFGQEYAGQKITLFEDVLKFIKNNGCKIFIEPSETLSETNETTVCNMLKNYGLDKNCGYFAYSIEILSRVSNKLPCAWLLGTTGNKTNAITFINALDELKTDINKVIYYDFDSETSLDNSVIEALKNTDVDFYYQVLTGYSQLNNTFEPYTTLEALDKYPCIKGCITSLIPAYLTMQTVK